MPVMLQTGQNCPNQSAFLPKLFDGLCQNDGTVHITSLQDVLVIINNAMRIAVALAGVLAVITILVASAYYILSVGDPGRVKTAKTILTNTTIGLVIIMGAYAILTFVAGAF